MKRGEVSIQSVDTSELLEIDLVENQCFPDGAYPYFVIRQMYDLFGDYFFLVRKESEPIAYIIGGIDNERRGWVLSLAVLKEHRKKGIGKLLIDKLVKKLKSSSVQYIRLTVNPANIPALSLFKFLDFCEMSSSDDYFGENNPRFVMELNIHE